MKIAIKFGDNDFHSTFLGVLETIFEIYQYNEVEPTKEELVNFINEVSLSIYLARQNDYKFESEGEKNRIKLYLEIEESHISLNDEVDDYIKIVGGDSNYGTYILDTDLDFPGNKVVYSI